MEHANDFDAILMWSIEDEVIGEAGDPPHPHSTNGFMVEIPRGPHLGHVSEFLKGAFCGVDELEGELFASTFLGEVERSLE
jgi:hypothetical protein